MAGASYRGDDAKLAKLIQKVEGIANQNVRRVLNSRLAEQSVSLVMQGFDASVSPEGKKWAPLRSRQGMPLLLTGRLRNSISWRATAAGFTLGSNVVYAGVHQTGSKKRSGRGSGIPARPFLPTQGRLSVKWRRSFESTVARFTRQQMGR